jgi:anaerobic ribonucleoside-triphosphate reductase
MNQQPAVKLTIQAIRQSLLQLSEYLTNEISVFENELNRTNQFIQESVDGVASSFKTTQKIAIKQQQLIDTIIQQDQTQSYAINQMADLSTGLAMAVGQGITALQFEDFTFQSLSSLEKNIHSIKQVNEQLNTIINSEENNFMKEIEQLSTLCTVLVKQSKEENKLRSVRQNSLSEGDIDLF